jgi:hypothetical protein
VYRVDQPTKDRYLTFRNRALVISTVAAAAVLLSGFLVPVVWQYGRPPAPLLALTADLFFLIAALLWMLHILRSGTRVSPELWTRPDPLTMLPLWGRVIWLVVHAGVVVWVVTLLRSYWSVWIGVAALVWGLVLRFRRRRELFSRSIYTPPGI